MGVDMPLDAVASIIKEQEQWEKSRQKKSTTDNIHKRYCLLTKIYWFY